MESWPMEQHRKLKSKNGEYQNIPVTVSLQTTKQHMRQSLKLDIEHRDVVTSK